ncbi:galanin receptor type 1-like [Stylophora pistillata]|uniref:galanin receptor type 1-like n=1 Tax=Stylophora pistillata TaxID=50429 RepID=UPI000C0419A5|nr:galanin receptor type 1-like [Stylophora pistillata]
MVAVLHNNTTGNATHPTAMPDHSVNIVEVVKVVSFWLIIIVGVMGNSLVIAVVKLFRSMRTPTNYLLVNVAAADIATLFFTAILFLITTRYSAAQSGAFASFVCKFFFTNSIAIITLLVTALTLTLLAFGRYQALVKPLSVTGRLTIDRIAYVITGIWMVAAALVIPLLSTFYWDPKKYLCSLGDAEYEMMVYIDCLIVVLTIVPFSLIAFFYSQIVYGMYFKNTVCGNKSERCDTPEETREKRKLVTLLILLTVIFFVAFIPYGVLLILKVSMVNHSLFYLRLQTASQYLTLLNCSINPFIYAFQSSDYRLAFKVILKKMLCRDPTEERSELLERRTRTSVRRVQTKV